MFRKLTICSLILVMTVFCSLGQAITHNVAVGESINTAIAGAAAGDTVSVAEGVFTELVTVGVDVVLMGAGPDLTIIQGQEVDPVVNPDLATTLANHVVTITGAAKVQDLTVRHGTYGSSNGSGISTSGDGAHLFNLHVTKNLINAAKKGAGILLDGQNNLVESCTIDSNECISRGGSGLFAAQRNGHQIINTTITNNIGTDGALEFWGNSDQTAEIINCTISGNEGGGLLISERRAGVTGYIKNNIIANNTVYDVLVTHKVEGVNTADLVGDNNIIGDSTGLTIELGSYSNIYGTTDLNLATILADNSTQYGTQTLALNPGSIAIDAGDATAINGVDVPLNDQRGYPRISPIDIGAFEYGADGAGVLVISAPNGGEIWLQGTAHDITWSSDNVTNAKLEYSTDAGATWVEIAASVDASLGTYAWTLPIADSPTCLVKITDVDDATVSDESDAAFSIVSPYVTLTAPNGGEEWQVGMDYEITWDYGFISNVQIEYTSDGSTWTELAATVDATLGTYTWTIPNDLSAICSVRLTVVENGTVSDASDAVFSIVLPVISIADARADANADLVPDNLGNLVHVIGVVTSPDYGGYYRAYHIGDETAGIVLHASGTDLELRVGDEVEVFGEVSQYNGLTQLEVTAADVTVLSTHNARTATLITLDQLGEATEGSFVKVDDVYLVEPGLWPAHGDSESLDLTDGTNTVTLRIDSDTHLDGWYPPQGLMSIRGVVSQYDSSDPRDGGYQLMGTLRHDFVDMGAGGNEIEVAAGMYAISNALATAGARDILVLTTDGGLYTDTTFIVNKPITIKAADGLLEKPVLEFAYGEGDTTENLIRAWADLTLEGLVLGQPDLTTATDTMGIFVVYSDTLMDWGQPGINNLVVNDCDFRNADKAIRQQFLENTSDGTTLDTLSITNSTFSNFLLARPLDFTGDSNNPSEIYTIPAASYVLIEDCSFRNMILPIRIANYDDGSRPSLVTINHCTFYNTANNHCMKIFGSDEGSFVGNLIFSNVQRWNVTKNIVDPIDAYPDSLHYSGWFNFDSRNNDMVAAASNCIGVADPMFADPLAGDFRLAVGSAYIGAASDGDNIGDRNWGTFVSNTAPVITDIPAQFTGEDTILVVPIVVVDAEGDALQYSATSDEANVVPSFLVDAMLTLTPAANWSGSANISVVVSDGVLADTANFVLVVGPIDDLPVVVSPFADVMVDEDAADLTIGDLDTVFVDVDESLGFEGVSLNEDLVTANITDGVVTLHFVANAWGSTEVVFIASNPVTRETASDTMMVTVNAINDAPTDFALNTPEDATTVTITAASLGDTLWFTWTDLIDVDGDELEVTLDGSEALGFLSTDVMFMGDSAAYITYSALADALPDNGVVSGSWTLSISDNISDPVGASNGPLSLSIDATAVGLHASGMIPDEFVLEANYPNPFNPATTLSFGIPEASQVVLSIYDLKGRMVSTIVNDNKEAGYHTAIWNGTNQNGQPVGAGMYIYRIQAGSFGQARKMILLK
ncbi:MAG: T9SS type A sorting domain-containing protein [FCB group bacterium]|nr:T9SS type A sorting domain-containing protein [FCB group bacterium]MBL7120407.1 T9SS type A sorting domain-containing protein [Candidatus Neomarinimicrobiota bacterium]